MVCIRKMSYVVCAVQNLLSSARTTHAAVRTAYYEYAGAAASALPKSMPKSGPTIPFQVFFPPVDVCEKVRVGGCTRGFLSAHRRAQGYTKAANNVMETRFARVGHVSPELIETQSCVSH